MERREGKGRKERTDKKEVKREAKGSAGGEK